MAVFNSFERGVNIEIITDFSEQDFRFFVNAL